MKRHFLSALAAIAVFASFTVTAYADDLGGSDNGPSETAVISENTTAVTVTDTKTGISVDADVETLPAGVESVTVKAEDITDTYIDIVEATVAEKIADLVTDASADVQIAGIYDISLIDQDGSAVSEFNGKIQVSIPCDDESVNAAVFYNSETGEVQLIPAVYKNGFAIFYVEHFSYYALAVVPEEVIAALDSAIIEDDTTPEDDDVPSAGDVTPADDGNPPTGIAIALVPVAAAGVVAFVSRKKNK